MKHFWVYNLLIFWGLTTTSIHAQADYNNQVQFVDSVNSLSFQYLTNNTELSLNLLLEAESIADSIGYEQGKAESLALMAGVYNYLGNWEEGVDARLRSIQIFEGLGLILEAGYGYTELAWSTRRRDYERSEYFMLKGLQILKSFPQSVELSNAYNNYGIIKLEQNQTDSALLYVNKSLEIKESNNDTLGISYSLGYLGSIYQQMEQYEEALSYLLKSYELKSSMADTSGMAIDLTNIASTYDLLEDRENAIQNYQASLNLALAINYHHLAEHNYNQLSSLFERFGQYDSSLHYQKLYNQFYQARVEETTDARIAELEVQFETEQKEKDLAIQRAELAASQLQIRNRNWILTALGSILILGGIITAMIIRQQKNKQRENLLKLKLAKSETENRIHQERERISRDLHDNVGAQITSLISGLEISNFYVKKDKTKDAISLLKTLDFNAREAMSELRETIWLLKKEEIYMSDFLQHLRTYFDSQKPLLNRIEVNIENKIPADFKLNPGQSLHMLRILQEGLNNCCKYAEATIFSVHFSLHEKKIVFGFCDNGNGYNLKSITNDINDISGNGITNMKRRIKELNGTLTINSREQQGFSVDFSFPV